MDWKTGLDYCIRTLGPRISVLQTLVVSALTLKTTTFRTFSEGNRLAWPLTGLVLLVERLAWLVAWFVNPLSRHLDFLVAAPLSLTITAMMVLTGPVVVWALMRFKGNPSLSSLLNFHVVSSGLSTLAAALVFLVGATFSPGLENDIRQIRSGSGTETRLYQTFCAPIALHAELFSTQRKINSFTSEYDLRDMVVYQRSADRREIMALLIEVAQKKESLSGPDAIEHERLHLEEQRIHRRINAIPLEQDQKWALDRYRAAVGSLVVVGLLFIIFVVWSLIFYWKLLVGDKIGIWRKTFWSFRYFVAISTSAAVSFIAVQYQTGNQFVPPVSLDAQIRQMEINARGVEPICGRINSRGLW